MASKVSSTLGLSSASMAASDIEFSGSSSSGSLSRSVPSSGCCSLSPTFSGLGLNGVGAGGADGGATGCGGTARRDGGALAGAVDDASPPGTAAGTALASGPAYVASRSIMSCRNTLSLFNSLRQMVTAWKVSGLSHRPAIIASRPASIRLAMATSPWRESRPIERISRRYMRTGSSVRSIGSLASDLAGVFGVISTSSLDSVSSLPRFSRVSSSSASVSSVSTTLMPLSSSVARASSICCGVTSSEGMIALSCS